MKGSRTSLKKYHNMKKFRIILVFMAAAVLAGCSALIAATEAESAASAELAADAWNNGNLCFVVDFINPSRGPSRYSQDGYKLTIKDGKVNAYLPFFGVSYNSSAYGTEPSGIEFKDCPIVIDDSRSHPEKGKYVWRFIANSGSQRVDVTLSFFSNGTAQLVCNPVNRSSMTYSGKLTKIAVVDE